MKPGHCYRAPIKKNVPVTAIFRVQGVREYRFGESCTLLVEVDEAVRVGPTSKDYDSCEMTVGGSGTLFLDPDDTVHHTNYERLHLLHERAEHCIAEFFQDLLWHDAAAAKKYKKHNVKPLI